MTRSLRLIAAFGIACVACALPARAQDFPTRPVFIVVGPGPDAMARLLTDLRPDYDLVLLDAPPVQAMTEARVVAAVADAFAAEGHNFLFRSGEQKELLDISHESLSSSGTFGSETSFARG